MVINLNLKERAEAKKALKKVLLPEMIQPLFAKGLSRIEVARELGLDYKYLSNHLSESDALLKAEKEGQSQYVASLIQAGHIKSAA
jgi:DNA-binding CsgD family transcriptional regulator